MTDTCRRIIIDRRGGPERLRLIEEPIPTPGPGEVLIRNEAVGVAFADVLIREGIYPGVSLPATPGYEVVGRIVGGDGDAGARVAAMTVHRGYASHVVVPAADCVAVPDALSSPQAAALVLNGLTALQMLTRCVAVDAVERMLVWGAAGGVGSLLLELGRYHGIEVHGVASGARLDFVRARGAIAIDRGAGDVADQVQAACGGVDVVFDGVGGANVARSLAALRSGGQVVMFGVQGGMALGRPSPAKLAALFLRTPRRSAQSLFMGNVGLRGYLIEEWKRAHPALYRDDLTTLFRLAAGGAITPAIDRVMPLADAAAAHARMNAGEAVGKIVLAP